MFHSKVTQISLKTSSIPACKARSLGFAQPLFCRPLCFGRRRGGGESSCWWGVPTTEIRKCQDFMVMNFPHGACCLVYAQSQKGTQDLNDLGKGLSKGSDMLLNPEQNYRQSYWNLAREDKEKIKLLQHFSVIERKYCSDCFFLKDQLHCASFQGHTSKVLILHLAYTAASSWLSAELWLLSPKMNWLLVHPWS